MFKKYLSKQSGFTLLEVLATLVISSILIGITYGVLTTTVTFNENTTSHINLRQEANIIITQLRQKHQDDEGINSEDLLSLIPDDTQLTQFELRNGGVTWSLSDNGTSINCDLCETDPNETLYIAFTIEDKVHSYDFEVNTAIEKIASYEPPEADPEDPDPPENDFFDYISDPNRNVFVYGSQFSFSGNQVNGPNATMVIQGNLSGSQLNGGAFNNVSNIYIGGIVDIDGGSAGLGSRTQPGNIYVNNNLSLWRGSRNIYGDVYVNGNFRLKDANIFGNVYVNGDVELGWTPTLSPNSTIYYTGTLTHPDDYRQSILDKVIRVSDVPSFEMPDFPIPSLREDEWYVTKGYDQTVRPSGMKVFGGNISIQSYTSSSGQFISSFTNAIVVSTGDINISGGSLQMTGVLFAPNGKVTFNGQSFEGLVIARDGFHVTSGGSTVTFRNITDYISTPEDFPLQ
ncbi:prepilin-type N-terminal cleavage/methylation domain-containing protein [Alkalihalophilus lindianensis]|uniref:Prepilin-type N-terminal cleavage/methylation domain-containing protein n=1 Tax=Alkalihalophilus lindianensis TaxID=1630542 RepID=A0ABU3X8K8_9BACI|nr:prepilin-type N-terminal cleavage/methylation domain-containing protein [Alkalihalophilus lindianensis]MDV2684222.1 prepilin-type N-terminal cleavage/methylation domain-containing protein [Alkalihalophilus lindianensis]